MSWQGWGFGLVGVPCGSADFQGVHVARAAVQGPGGPAGVFFGVVAGFAQSCAVGEVRFSAGLPGNHVVDMPDGASQYGVRQVSSRVSMKRRSRPLKSRALESVPRSSPVPGAV
ncbi:hypothetical protein SAMN04487912_11378 [Arthrobacter sp. cf158]|nr:hypothetical protein SAMN04487912_11378 [Arthrobacter sp. cf158]